MIAERETSLAGADDNDWNELGVGYIFHLLTPDTEGNVGRDPINPNESLKEHVFVGEGKPVG